MTDLDAALVRRKLATILANLADLAAVEGLALADYRADRFRQKGTERLLQEAVEAAVDANLHLLRTAGTTPTDYYDSFVQMGRHGLLTEQLAQALAPAAGLRNRLVHEYDGVDDAVVLATIPKARRLLADYAAAIEAVLRARGR